MSTKIENIDSVSNKIDGLIKKSSKRQLNLPRHEYGPYCNKILSEAINHFKLNNLPLPSAGDMTHVALSKIFDIILHTMGEEKREEILKDLDEYIMSIPAVLR